ncbi:chromate resistance protein [Stappia sp. F7233]|uniref:Chromate resistance protein n=1 Tax=Stappia albiluteola TaxID=2758565 RepID=A0A839AEJ3_9HYPH|nr:sulfurtransferase/chromate resistance protein [Stappia albiluteola]MBA5777374.1 chromate resistance protein [Stappia albiluteola]
MPSNTEITVQQLSRLVGLPDQPRIIDVRLEEDFQLDRRLIPASKRMSHAQAIDCEDMAAGDRVVVVCEKGRKLSQGVAAVMRERGIAAETLEGGFVAWREHEGLLVHADAVPKSRADGRTVWVTRARPKIDRVACPWLIRRFVDPDAIFLYVDQSEVEAVAEIFEATPFDIAGVFWSHRGESCTFDTMVEEFGLTSEPLLHMARIVRGADTDRLDLTRQSPGFLAAALGLSRMYKDDLAQLDAAMTLCDAFYRWCRDAVGESHSWVVNP